jgi:hypothetical protein
MLAIEARVFLWNMCCGGDYTEEKFVKMSPTCHVPHRNTVRPLIDKFRETGSVADTPRSGSPRVLTEDKILYSSDRIMQSTRKSICKLSQQAGDSYSSTQRALKNQLHLHPYKVTSILPMVQRLPYTFWKIYYLRKIFSDETWFRLSEYLNSQNGRVWSAFNPHEIMEIPLHNQRVGVFCAISRSRIIGPIFFEDTVNSERYCELVND